MLYIKIIFFFSGAILFHSYGGYAILASILIKFRKKPRIVKINEEARSVTLLIAAYNEEDFIEEKIKNSLALSYPKDKLLIYIVTDGSTDRTTEIVNKYKEIKLFHENSRNGKVAAIDRAMQFVTTDIVVFSDANTTLNAESIHNIVRHYSDPTVGGVAGEKRVVAHNAKQISGSSEGLYWRYESTLKSIDSTFYSVVGAAGELFSVRTNLYSNPGKDVILDDFVISLKICQKGYRIIYEPEAYATEGPSKDIHEEKKRKIRIGAGGFQGMAIMKHLLRFWKTPMLSYLYISHRVLRWTLCPFAIPILFISNAFIFFNTSESIFAITWYLQLVFYTLAIIGWGLSKFNAKSSLPYIAYYFLFMNICLYQGLINFLLGKQSAVWDKAKREIRL
jgi:cellulose synthase/poly-beta-1,6-N-acetylglucosamine synthase-like glycosyltransferase